MVNLREQRGVPRVPNRIKIPKNGEDGAPGADGADGQGVPVGGTAGQVLEKIDGDDFNTQWATPAAGGTSLVPMQNGGRAYLYTDNRWVTNSSVYGLTLYNISTNAGTGSDPNLNWHSIGHWMRSGDKLHGADLVGRVTNTDVTGVDWRLYFKTGPWDGTWNNNGASTDTLVLDETWNPQNSLGEGKLVHDLSTPFEATADGWLVPYYRPVGTLAATRYLYHAHRLLVELA